jgi:hypothetical protein
MLCINAEKKQKKNLQFLSVTIVTFVTFAFFYSAENKPTSTSGHSLHRGDPHVFVLPPWSKPQGFPQV